MNQPRAGFLRRLAALFFDCVALEILGSLALLPLAGRLNVNPEEIADQLIRGEGWEAAVFLLIYSLVLLGLWGFYFTFFIGWSGQTPGKKLLGIRVVRTDGSPVDYATAFNRFIGYTISGGVFLIGFLWALFDRNGQTWHDKMARTMVIRNESTQLNSQDKR